MRLASSTLSPCELAFASAILLDQRYPLIRRALFAAIAVGGTLIYGYSLSRLIELPIPAGLALALTIVTGVSWVMFGVGMRLGSGLSWWRCADHCLLAMVIGEAVLMTAASVNGIFSFWLRDHALFTGYLNLGFVLISDVAMGACLASAFGRDGVRRRKTWLLWLLVLNGAAALMSLFFLNLNT